MRRVSVLLCRFRLGGEIMERLTKTYSDGTHGANDNLPCGENSYTYKGLLLEALGKYEDLEEQGLLLRLPCKVGSTVYLIRSRYTECSKYKETWNDCYGCEDECDSHKEYYIHINHSVSNEWIVRNMNDFGKTVFLTQAEAEQKLKEMESE